MIKILETKKVNLKFSDLEPGEVFILDGDIGIAASIKGGNVYFSLMSQDSVVTWKDIFITEIVTKYEYNHDTH